MTKPKAPKLPPATKKAMIARIATTQTAVDTAKKNAKRAKLNFRESKQKLKEAKRAAKKLRKALKALKSELAAFATKKTRRKTAAPKLPAKWSIPVPAPAVANGPAEVEPASPETPPAAPAK